MESLLAWLPLLVIFLLLVIFARKSNSTYQKHIDEVNAVNQQIVDTNKEMIGVLEDIRDELRKPK